MMGGKDVDGISLLDLCQVDPVQRFPGRLPDRLDSLIARGRGEPEYWESVP